MSKNLLCFALASSMAVIPAFAGAKNLQYDIETVSAGKMAATVATVSPTSLELLNARKSPLAAEAEGVTLTIKILNKKRAYAPKMFTIYNEDSFASDFVSSYLNDDGDVEINDLTMGTYTILVSFDETSSERWGYNWTKCYVFLEDVEISADTTVEVNPADTHNQFIGKTILPDGQVACVDIKDAEGNTVSHPGNIFNQLIQVSIFDTKYNAWAVIAIGSTGEWEQEDFFAPGVHWDPQSIYNIRVNDISDRFIITQQRDNYFEEGMYATVAYSRGVSNLDLSNDYTNYRTISESFTHTPFFEDFGGPGQIQQNTELGYEGWVYYPYAMLPWIYPASVTGSTVMFSDGANAEEFDMMHPNYRQSLIDVFKGYDEFCVKGHKFYFDSEGAYYEFNNFSADPEITGVYPLDNDGEVVYYEYPGQTELRVLGSQVNDYIYGNSAPVNIMMPLVYVEEGEFRTNFNPNYVGLLGEEREADKIGLDALALHNGSLGATGTDWNYFWAVEPNDSPEGVYEAILNNVNARVDGLQAYNYTTLHLSYTGEDICPPTLQAFQVRGVNGEVSLDFESFDRIEVKICAGDYDYSPIEDGVTYKYDSNPVSVTVETAPHGADNSDWTAMNVVADTDYDNLAGYGKFFRATPGADAKPGDEGWVDVRVTIEDQAGNKNIQTMGPVFCIRNLTGLQDATDGSEDIVEINGKVSMADGSEADFDFYSLDGRHIATFHGTVATTDNLTGGVYIVKATTAAATYTIKLTK